MEVPFVEPQLLVLRTHRIIEELAGAWHRCLIGCAVENEHGQGDARKFLLEPLVGADQRGYGQRRLN
jgi:hypothetical protein